MPRVPRTGRPLVSLASSVVLLAAFLATSAYAATVPAPASFLGFEPGADRHLASWQQVLDYLHAVDAASDRVSIEIAGKSTSATTCRS
jgi:hypothetical protein